MEKWAIMLLTGLFLGAAFLIGSPAVKAMVNGKKQVMLTFDDGPHPDYTLRILDILDQHQVKAIFFVVGQEVDHNTTIVEEIHQRGHLLGNHTYSHRNVTTIPRETLLEELAATDALIENITGYNPAFFRPPRGDYNIDTELILAETGHSMLMWDACLERLDLNKSRQAVDTLLRRTAWKTNLVLLLHDGDPSGRHSRQITVDALPLLIEELRVRNYQFIDPTSPSGAAFIAAYIEAGSSQWYREPRFWAGSMVLLASLPVIALRRKAFRQSARQC